MYSSRLGSLEFANTSYAGIAREETESFGETREALDHESEATMRVYVARAAVQADMHSRKVTERMKRSTNVGS